MKKLTLRTPTPPPTASLPSSPVPLWVGGSVRLTVKEGGGKSWKEVRAKLRGSVAVHEDVFRDEEQWDGYPVRWTVTAVGTGLTVCKKLKDEAEALKVGAVLAGQGALGLKSKAAVLRQLPKWVGQWCLACAKAGTYLDPAPYRKKEGER